MGLYLRNDEGEEVNGLNTIKIMITINEYEKVNYRRRLDFFSLLLKGDVTAEHYIRVSINLINDLTSNSICNSRKLELLHQLLYNLGKPERLKNMGRINFNHVT